jgi:hypothetical protein
MKKVSYFGGPEACPFTTTPYWARQKDEIRSGLLWTEMVLH